MSDIIRYKCLLCGVEQDVFVGNGPVPPSAVSEQHAELLGWRRAALLGEHGTTVVTSLWCCPVHSCRGAEPVPAHDAVNHPAHYTSSPAGVECITVVEHMTFNVGNAVKYCWRAGLKSDDAVTDLKKAAWYIAREIQRLEKK